MISAENTRQNKSKKTVNTQAYNAFIERISAPTKPIKISEREAKELAQKSRERQKSARKD